MSRGAAYLSPGDENRVVAVRRNWAPCRAKVIRELTEDEREGVIELSRGVLTGDDDLLEEARSMGIPAFDRVEIDAAIRAGTLRDLLERPLPEVLPASA